MNVSPINNNYSYQPKPAFKAIVVDKLEPILKQKGVTFYNNATAMLDKPTSLFEGVKVLINALIENDKQDKEMLIDMLDVSRMYDMLKLLPKKIFANRTLFGVIGAGANVTALQLDNDEVLSLANNMESFDLRPFESFDLPLKSSDLYNTNDRSRGWYVRAFGQPVTTRELEALAKRIRAKGYVLEDWRTEQACNVNGKTYLVDFECAQLLTDPRSFLLGFF